MDCNWFSSGRARKKEQPPGVVPPVAPSVMRPPIRVTDEQDGRIIPRMMSDRANAFVQGADAFVLCGTDAGPRLFHVDLASGHVERRGPIGTYGGETEGWYWLPNGRIILPHGPRLLSVNPINPDDAQTVLDISATHPGHDLWQPHSSDDGRTHSATVRDAAHPNENGRYPYVGTVIEGPHGRRFEAAVGQLDESQVTRNGSHVVIKQNGDDNRFVNLATGDTWNLSDVDGAFGHSDCGPDYIVGEVNLPGPGRCVKLDLVTFERTTLFETDRLGYVSVRVGRCLLSSDTHLSLVDLSTGHITPLIEHGANAGDNYDLRVKANIDPSGTVACYMVNGVVYLLVL